jgi:hypothetical protein
MRSQPAAPAHLISGIPVPVYGKARPGGRSPSRDPPVFIKRSDTGADKAYPRLSKPRDLDTGFNHPRRSSAFQEMTCSCAH